jgi:hypothetical protein
MKMLLTKLKKQINKYKYADIVFISDYYRLRNVGSEKPIHNYINYAKKNGLQIEIIYCMDGYKAIIKLLLATLFSKNVIVNGVRPYQNYRTLIFGLIKRPYYYFHETKYVFDKILKQYPLRTKILHYIMKKSFALCTSKAQLEYFKKEFFIKQAIVIYNNNYIKKGKKKQDIFDNNKINIVMAGTIQNRKGATFFSKLADFVKNKNNDFQFHWIGKKALNEQVYQSENVIWHGFKKDYLDYLASADVFFLASIDDPMPLTAFDALNNNLKCIVYKNVGTAELINDIQGCAIYNNYTIESAYTAIFSVLNQKLDKTKVKNIIDNFTSVESFANRLESFLNIKNINYPKTKVHTNINLKNINIVKYLKNMNKRPLLIVGNGPSLKKINYNLMPDNAVIFRTNMFFLEDKFYVGKNIDAYFWSVYREELQDSLENIVMNKVYNIKSFFYPMNLNNFNGKKERISINKKHTKLFNPSYDHWAIIATKPEIARLLMSRPLPTTGLQMLAVAMILGYKEIYLVGVDFYQSTDVRYAFDIPDNIKKTLGNIHFTPGYEKGAHSFEYDLFFFNFLRNLYPEVQLYSISKHSYISTLIPMAKKNKQYTKIHLDKK